MAYQIDIQSLPPRYQKQVLEQIQKQAKQKLEAEEKKKTVSKYHNQATETAEGVKFRSKKEERRYWELKAMLKNDEIEDLKLEPQFTLVEGYKKPDGTRVRRLHYTADFSYRKDGQLVVEDVKSRVTKTEAYQLRKTLMKDKYGIDIVEI